MDYQGFIVREWTIRERRKAYMCYMDILFPKLLRQALRKSPHSKLTRRKGARHNVAPGSCRRTCEDEGTSRSSGFIELFVIFERKDRATRERKCRSHVRLEGILNFLRCDFEEWFPNTIPDVEYGCADNVFRLGELCMDGAPCRRYVFVRIRREGERCGLFIAKSGLQFK